MRPTGRDRLSRRAVWRAALVAATISICALWPAFAADTVKIGVVKSTTSAPLYVAIEKGFFAAEGIDAQLVFFDAAQPISVGVVSGDLDFGVTGYTGGFYQLAAQGALKIIAAHSGEVPGFHGLGYFVANRAYEAGFRSLKDIPGHSVALTTIGSAFHYSLALAGEKYGFELQTVKLQAMQTNPNAVSAVTGGSVDMAMVTNAFGVAMLAHDAAKLVAWVGDETPWQLGAAFVATKTADTRGDLITRFLRAYRRGARLYHDAVTGPNELQRNGPMTPEMLAIIAKTLGQSVTEVGAAIAYADPDERVDVKDVLHQIAWFRQQGMVKGDFNPADMVDRRYVIPRL
jgi:NitT/TauT family transport system substrate-binding protein